MWLYDLETLHFLEVNDAAVYHYGYSREEFLQMQVTEIWATDDLDSMLEADKQLRSTSQQCGLWKHRRRNGETIDVETQAQVLELGAGRQRS
jgi:PAS domain S-box-containing protein